jgi:hypothetical protein
MSAFEALCRDRYFRGVAGKGCRRQANKTAHGLHRTPERTNKGANRPEQTRTNPNKPEQPEHPEQTRTTRTNPNTPVRSFGCSLVRSLGVKEIKEFKEIREKKITNFPKLPKFLKLSVRVSPSRQPTDRHSSWQYLCSGCITNKSML